MSNKNLYEQTFSYVLFNEPIGEKLAKRFLKHLKKKGVDKAKLKTEDGKFNILVHMTQIAAALAEKAKIADLYGLRKSSGRLPENKAISKGTFVPKQGDILIKDNAGMVCSFHVFLKDKWWNFANHPMTDSSVFIVKKPFAPNGKEFQEYDDSGLKNLDFNTVGKKTVEHFLLGKTKLNKHLSGRYFFEPYNSEMYRELE